jgi:hypothetical protein
MTRMPELTLPLPDPLALLDATALFVIQVLIAQHPELLAVPEPPPSPPRPLGHASLLLVAVRDLQDAIEVYRSRLSDSTGDDDLPF